MIAGVLGVEGKKERESSAGKQSSSGYHYLSLSISITISPIHVTFQFKFSAFQLSAFQIFKARTCSRLLSRAWPKQAGVCGQGGRNKLPHWARAAHTQLLRT